MSQKPSSSTLPERVWCGEKYPRWHAAEDGSVYRDGIRINPCLSKGYPNVGHANSSVFVHVLVATAFHGPRPAGMCCRHLNDIRTDNRAVNLRWGTPSENEQDKVRNGLHRFGDTRGELNGQAKITAVQVSEIRALYRQGGWTLVRLGARYGISFSHVSQIVNNKCWRSVEPA